ncbi:MAG TPA: RNA polymerase recycling motor HelD [Bacillota bacterium]|nr:RNA polymerase recycling motor HelD [Bacillota bacterium]
MTIHHKDWHDEQRRLSAVKERIHLEMQRLEGIVAHRQSEVMDFRRNFWDEVTVNMSDYDEIAETAASITQQQNLMNQEVRSFRHAESNLHKLLKLYQSPYFARIDFKEEAENETESIYIGIGSVVDEQTHELIVYDWRAPVSGMFYDYTPGPAQYKTPSGLIEGEMKLKRQYIIKQGQLENMFDTGINIGDEMLQILYAKNPQERMSSIVTTIQQEQNQIIREDDHQFLIVQGAAGSGKTSVALQRVAYLLYKHRNSLSSDNMLLFSPNSIFNDYVSNVLPELGETNMLQTTFQEHVERAFGKGLTVEDAYDQLEYLLKAKDDDPAYQVRVRGIEWKTSRSFMSLLNRYMEFLSKDGVLFQSFSIKEKVIISSQRLTDLFYNQFSHDPSISSRIDKIKDWILQELKEREEKLFRKYFQKMIRDPRYLGSDKEMKAESRKKAHRLFAPLREQAKQLVFVDVLGMYCRLFTDPAWFKKKAGHLGIEEKIEEIGSYTLSRIMNGVIPYEDATAILYMQTAFEGIQVFNRIKQVVIDEAQDYSPFQLEYIRSLFPRGRFTLLGDFNQGIYHANVQSYEWIENLFDQSDLQTYRMSKSYRSTDEIINFTKQILCHPEPIEGIGRHGEAPQITGVQSEEQLIEAALQGMKMMISGGANSVAVICKTEEETIHTYKQLKNKTNGIIHLITKKTLKFMGGVVVIPSYLAKGLEFDGVIVYNAGKEVYGREAERKLLYTVCTRAMHQLHIHYKGEISPFIME